MFFNLRSEKKQWRNWLPIESLSQFQWMNRTVMTESELQIKIAELASLIAAPENVVPPVLPEPVEGKLVVLLNNEQIRIVHQERGGEVEYVSTKNPDEALYWIFSRMVGSISMSEPIGGEYDGLDKRRYWLKRDLELFEKAQNPVWQARREKEIAENLSKIPYRDSKDSR